MSSNKNHIENFNGVNIEFTPPFMAEQRRFRLREKGLGEQETLVIAEARSTLADFINFLRLKERISFNNSIKQSRKPFDYIKSDENIFIAPLFVKDWVIHDNTIQFSIDFHIEYGMYPNLKPDDHPFRDKYIFKKIDGKWMFFDNIGAEPIGFLKCKSTDKSCHLDDDLN
jgi:hypothetical protein